MRIERLLRQTERKEYSQERLEAAVILVLMSSGTMGDTSTWLPIDVRATLKATVPITAVPNAMPRF